MPTSWVVEKHRRFITDYLAYKKISLSALNARLGNRDKVNGPSSLDFMTRTAPELAKRYDGLDKKRLCYCLREMEANLIADPMDYSLSSARSDGMDYSLTSSRNDGMDYSLTSGRTDQFSESMVGMDISVAEDELVQRIGNIRFRDDESTSGDVSMSSQSTKGYLPIHLYGSKYRKQRNECESLARDVRVTLQTIQEKMGWAWGGLMINYYGWFLPYMLEYSKVKMCKISSIYTMIQ